MTNPEPGPSRLASPTDPAQAKGWDRVRGDGIATLGGIVILCIIAVPRIISTPPWTDEAYTVAATEHLTESITFSHFTMSGYYAVLWLWGQVSTSIIWLRMFSLVCAVLTIVCVRSLAIVIGGRRLATLAVLIVPFLAMFQWKATEARAYALETLIISVCWLVVATGRLRSANGRWWWLALVVVGVFGEFIHGMFVLQFLPISVYLVVRNRRPAGLVRASLLTAVPAATALILWMNGASHVGTAFAGDPADWLAHFFDTFFGRTPAIVLVGILGVTWWIVATVRPAIRGGRWPAMTTWIPALWVIVPTVGLCTLSLAVNRFNPRYLAPILPGLAILFAQVGASLDRSLRQVTASPIHTARSRRLTGSLGSIIVVGIVIAGSVATPPFVDSPWQGIVQRVAGADPTGNCIVFAELSDTHPSQIRTPFETAWRIYESDQELAVISSERQLGSPRRFDPSLSRREVAERARRCQTVWLLFSVNFDVDPTERLRSIAPFTDEFESLPPWTPPGGPALTELQRIRPP